MVRELSIRATYTRFAKMLLVYLAVPMLAGGCVLARAAKNNEALALVGSLQGSLRLSDGQGMPAFVGALRRVGSGWQLYSSRVTTISMPYQFFAVAGEYRVFAFVDLNGDSAWSDGEPSAEIPLRQLAPGEVAELPELAPVYGGPAFSGKLSFDRPDVSQELVKVHRGTLAQLDEERFSDEAAAMAYWQPAEFALKYGVGISFLEPYDSRKIPVLFVHGASGSPRNFAHLIAAMDRSHFQPWVFSYPSGIRLDFATAKLVHIVDDLHQRHRFPRMAVVGHSMGGLVARSFALRAAGRPNQDYVRMLVTIAAPFNGHEAAGKGVAMSPVVLPSWNDMATHSPFLLSLRVPLPAATPHHLFFTYVGGASGGGPTDGTISVRSMLPTEIQANVGRTVGFAEDHDSILKSPELIGELNASLRQAIAGGESSGAAQTSR